MPPRNLLKTISSNSSRRRASSSAYLYISHMCLQSPWSPWNSHPFPKHSSLSLPPRFKPCQILKSNAMLIIKKAKHKKKAVVGEDEPASFRLLHEGCSEPSITPAACRKPRIFWPHDHFCNGPPFAKHKVFSKLSSEPVTSPCPRRIKDRRC